MSSVALLEKEQFLLLAPELFAILDTNMREILPGRLSYAEEYALWFSAVEEGLRADARQILLVRENGSGRLLGFAQYYANPDVLMLEEELILPEYQGKPNFLGKLSRFLLASLSVTPSYVEAYTHRENVRSIALQQKLGMAPVATEDDFPFLHFRGAFAAFSARFTRC
jgi:hypothetical protein